MNRRLRLHRLAETYITMDNAGAGLFQDEKPKVFSPQGYCGEAVEYPAFYSSREVKEMGIDTTQVRSCLLYTSNGYWCKNSGSYHALIPAAAEAWGLPVSGCTTSEPFG